MVKIRRQGYERLTRYINCDETNSDILDRLFSGYDMSHLLNNQNAKNLRN